MNAPQAIGPGTELPRCAASDPVALKGDRFGGMMERFAE